MYPCPNVRSEQYDVFTNAGPCAAFRAPGQVQGIFALEQSLDELAERLGHRSARAARQDRYAATPTTSRARAGRAAHRRGEVRLDAAAARRARTPDRSSAASAWRSRSGSPSIHPPTRLRSARSAATARSRRSAARRTSAPARAPCWRRWWPRSSACAPRTSAAHIGDTRYPAGPPSGGSRVTGSLTPAARNAAYRAARDLAGAARAVARASTPDDIVFQRRPRRSCAARPATWLTFKEAVKKAGVDEISHRADRRDDYDGYMMSTPAICASASTASAACSSPRSRSTPRPASSRSSASSRCTTAAGRSTRS